MPYFQLGSILGPIQAFGVIVAIGVAIGGTLLRRYALAHGVAEEHIRRLTTWIMVTGLIGAHLFYVLAYARADLARDPLALVRIWEGISSYGGFIGGALGFAFGVWWKRQPARRMADVAIIGLLPAFSIGRIGCAVVSDHVGAPVGDPQAWYAAVAMEYPRAAIELNGGVRALFAANPDAGATLLAWNLGLVELLYLIPVNAVVLWLAFRSRWKLPAGLLAVTTGLLYAPVRFFMDYLRLAQTDPRYLGFTPAQWASVLAFAAAMIVAARMRARGAIAEPR